jgi:hypothetical protein
MAVMVEDQGERLIGGGPCRLSRGVRNEAEAVKLLDSGLHDARAESSFRWIFLDFADRLFVVKVRCGGGSD